MRKILLILFTVICCIGLIGCENKQNEIIKSTEETKPIIAEKRELTEEIIKEETKKLTSTYDDFDEITFYYSPKVTTVLKGKTYISIFKGIYFYIGEKENHVWLRGVIKYSSDNWIFMKKVEIKTGEEIYDIYFDYDDVNRQSDRSIYETYDCNATIQLYDIAKEIVKNNEGKIKFIGDDKSKTIDITKDEIDGLSEIIEAYDNLTKIK